MYIADEILKFLVCEVCFENYNQKNRIPYALFPCGHTFCESCVKQFRNRMCAACNTQFENKTKNWALINLIPGGKIVDDYELVKQQLENGLENLENLKTLNHDHIELNNPLFDQIRKQINDRAAYLIEKIKEGQNILISSVKQVEDKWNFETKIESDYEKTLTRILNEFNSRINSEEIKTDNVKFTEFRNLLKINLDDLDRRIQSKNSEEYVTFKLSDFDLEAAFDIENLFGELSVNNHDELSENNSGDKEMQMLESLSKIDDIYSEIDEKVP